MLVPEKLTNFRVYGPGGQLYGIADCELPGFEAVTEEVSGAGIAGTIDEPTVGQFASQTLTINWRQLNTSLFELAKPIHHDLVLRGSQEVYESSTGLLQQQAVQVKITGRTKNTTPGSMSPGSPSEGSTEIETVVIGYWVDDVEQIYFDKMNFILRVHGVDYLATARRNMGG
jgi:P2 family phage contractile tail tube protein